MLKVPMETSRWSIYVLQTVEALITSVFKEVNSKGSSQDHVRQPAGAQRSFKRTLLVSRGCAQVALVCSR